MPIRLGKLAAQFDCELIGDADLVIDNVASLSSAGPRSLSFLSSSAYIQQLPSTGAAAVILRAADSAEAKTAVLINDNPYACFARMAAVIHPRPEYAPGIHASAVVSKDASVAKSAHVAAHAFIGDRSSIGKNVYVGPGVVIGPDCAVGDDCRLIANVTLVRSVSLGSRTIVHPGTVIGSDGFGNAMTPEGWVKVPQLGGVLIGNDVEIGANCTIDCGALEDTVIEDGVRLDNIVHIAHNVRIGAHSALAGMTGIAGSAVIGKRCMFAGQTGVVGHVTICDDAIVGARGMITRNITEPGVYTSGFPAEKSKDWNRQVARFRRLEKLAERVSKLEKETK